MTNGNDPLHSGNQAFLDEDYPAAIQAYGEAIALSGEGEAIARSNRAAAYLKLGKHREALQDASAAVKLKPTEIAFYRKGLASFALEEYETALEAFRRGQQAAAALSNGEAKSDSRKYPTWIRKCEAEMEAEDVDMEPSVDETHKEPAEPAVPDVPVAVAAPMDATPTPSGADGAVAARTQPEASAPLHVRVKFQYYQSHEKITVSILERGLTEDEVEVEIAARRLTVRRRRDLALLFDKVLYDEVVVDKHRTRFVPAKMEVTLTKKSPGDWPELEGKGNTTPTMPQPADTVERKEASIATAKDGAAKVPRPYSSSKNWDVVEREVQRELDADKPEGEEALNHLFKQIYGNADPDTRRAMIKSFQTSGGTVLSTNWDEVSKADYEKERQAPKGMEWRTWEGRKLPQKDDDN